MSEKKEAILQAEKDARELVNNLKALKEKVESFSVAKNELEKTNTNLLSFIEDTKTLAEDNRKIISTINKIGSANIFKKIKLNSILIIVGFVIVIILQVLNFII